MENKKVDFVFRGRGHNDFSFWFDHVLPRIESFKPDFVVFLNAFTQEDSGRQKMVIELLSKLHKFGSACYNGRNCTAAGKTVSGPLALSESDIDSLRHFIKIYEKVLMIVPDDIFHLIFIETVIQGRQHPGVGKSGKLLSDARWILESKPDEQDLFDLFVRSVINFAHPFSNSAGSGERLLHLYITNCIRELKIRASYARERVILAETFFRLEHRYQYSSLNGGVLTVDATNYGNFHFGTLAEIAAERWRFREGAIVIKQSSRAPNIKKPQYLLLLINFTCPANAMSALAPEAKIFSPQFADLGFQIPAKVKKEFDVYAF